MSCCVLFLYEFISNIIFIMHSLYIMGELGKILYLCAY